MKNILRILFYLSLFFLVAFEGGHGSENKKKQNYFFKETISRAVLENYLARSATIASLLHFTLDDDLRMIQNLSLIHI